MLDLDDIFIGSGVKKGTKTFEDSIVHIWYRGEPIARVDNTRGEAEFQSRDNEIIGNYALFLEKEGYSIF